MIGKMVRSWATLVSWGEGRPGLARQELVGKHLVGGQLFRNQRLGDKKSLQLVKAGGGEVTIDLVSLRITLPDGASTSFPLEPFSRHCLLEGVDELAYLIAQDQDITAYERRNPDSLQGATHDV